MGASWRAGIDPLPTALVTNGLYAVARNPIFAGVMLTVAGVVAITPSPWSILISAPVFLLINLQVRAEERHLIALHGARYLDYASRVAGFCPGPVCSRGAARLWPSSSPFDDYVVSQ